jgi:hypothetical protein
MPHFDPSRWFAWHPVQLRDGPTVWLRWVDRRRTPYKYGFGYIYEPLGFWTDRTTLCT